MIVPLSQELRQRENSVWLISVETRISSFRMVPAKDVRNLLNQTQRGANVFQRNAMTCKSCKLTAPASSADLIPDLKEMAELVAQTSVQLERNSLKMVPAKIASLIKD